MTQKNRAELQASNQRKREELSSQRVDIKSALGTMEKLSESVACLSATLKGTSLKQNQVEDDQQVLILASAESEAEIGGKNLLSDFHTTTAGSPSPLAVESTTVASASVSIDTATPEVI